MEWIKISKKEQIRRGLKSVCKLKQTPARRKLLELIKPNGTEIKTIIDKLENTPQSTYKKIKDLEKAKLIRVKMMEKKVYLTSIGSLFLSINN